MSKNLTKTVIIVSSVFVLLIGLTALLLINFIPNLRGFVLPKQASLGAAGNSANPCQCVGYVTNSLFGVGNIVTKGSWNNAQDLDNDQYWTYAREKFGISLNKVPNPVNVKPGDVIIMHSDALVYIKRDTGGWDKLNYVGQGSGHIGFVQSAFYYNQDFKEITSNGQSGWLITMRSANWGTNYSGNLTYPPLSNPYGTFFSDTSCSNVTDSQIFLPTGNPVSFWRR